MSFSDASPAQPFPAQSSPGQSSLDELRIEARRVVDRLRSYPIARLGGIVGLLEDRVGELVGIVADAEGHGHGELPSVPQTAWGDVVAVQVSDLLMWASTTAPELSDPVLRAAAAVLTDIRRSI